ncbi:Uncharacterized membrane protein YphA, DoxX/SURF4 family [Actinacidiphila alni]|uniref:Uncharacterized membrane protein YphA, DoxX/SURF4 family n=2 Tax=Actinacidiphila alni TaxID=380248 RepID=A0A1I2KN03_9ACTN|nr:Uncharacterized membrane protein YphA, DoxX/SURF4 family [Actinacidiphila alni]
MPGFDEPAPLSMARVPSDPAQVIVNHASFRVQLGATSGRALSLGSLGGSLDDTARIPVVTQAQPGTAGRRKLSPVVWSGHSAPGDPAAGELLQAVRRAGAAVGGSVGASVGGGDASAGAATQLLPRIGDDADGTDTTVLPPVPTVVGQRAGQPPTGLLSGVRPATGAYDDDPDEPRVGYVGGPPDAPSDGERRPRTRSGEPAKHAWYPDRRMNLGIVLLPLRIFLGFVSIYAGMGKLCDPVYFDGGKRGSMVTWLNSLHPWALAEPLRDSALNHPVGAGLSIAFLQVVVGVLTVCGLWQRVAAFFGAGLSIALLVTVSWKTVPVYDAPDFIYLAAWSPLVIAGAPVYSIDGHLAGDAWRRLGPRVTVWDLRRRVLRRGAVLATVIAGLTLLIGSVLGAAVRASSTHDDKPLRPQVVPTNNLPGSPLPEVSGGDSSKGASPKPSASASAKAKKDRKKAQEQQQTTAPAAGAPSSSSSSSSHTAGSTPSHSSSSGGSSSGGSSGGGSDAPPPSAPPSQPSAPPPSAPAAKPTQGAIGGLLGLHVLGEPPAPSPASS